MCWVGNIKKYLNPPKEICWKIEIWHESLKNFIFDIRIFFLNGSKVLYLKFEILPGSPISVVLEILLALS